MAFELRWTPDARDHLAALPAHQRAMVIDEADMQLKDRPDQTTRRRKLLRENPLATWELRIGELRVFYNIDIVNSLVEIVAVGVKDRNRLLIGGEEIEL
jgi:mRNA-degrading endonuclease RelE of RelBE toxin-antitoxin system